MGGRRRREVGRGCTLVRKRQLRLVSRCGGLARGFRPGGCEALGDGAGHPIGRVVEGDAAARLWSWLRHGLEPPLRDDLGNDRVIVRCLDDGLDLGGAGFARMIGGSRISAGSGPDRFDAAGANTWPCSCRHQPATAPRSTLLRRVSARGRARIRACAADQLEVALRQAEAPHQHHHAGGEAEEPGGGGRAIGVDVAEQARQEARAPSRRARRRSRDAAARRRPCGSEESAPARNSTASGASTSLRRRLGGSFGGQQLAAPRTAAAAARRRRRGPASAW